MNKKNIISGLIIIALLTVRAIVLCDSQTRSDAVKSIQKGMDSAPTFNY